MNFAKTKQILCLGAAPAGDPGLTFQPCRDAYEAGQRLTADAGSFAGLVVDAAVLSSTIIQLLALLRRHQPQLSLWLAPAAAGTRSSRVAEALALGVQVWPGSLPRAAVEPARAARVAAPSAARSAPKADKPASDNAVVPGDALEAEARTRYDALAGQPLLSDDEMRALLEEPEPRQA